MQYYEEIWLWYIVSSVYHVTSGAIGKGWRLWMWQYMWWEWEWVWETISLDLLHTWQIFQILTLLLLVANLANTKWWRKTWKLGNYPLCYRWVTLPILNDARNLKNDWNLGIWVLIWKYSGWAVLWIPAWHGPDDFQKRCLKTWTPEEWLKPWHMGTHMKVLSVSYPMNTNMTGFRWFSKIFASLYLGRK